MNAQTASKTENKGNGKTNQTKSGTNQEKVIKQLQQEIELLNNTVTAIQKRQDTQAVVVAIPSEMLNKVHTFNLKFSQVIGRTYTLSNFICDAVEMNLWALNDEYKYIEEENRWVELETGK